MPQVSFGVHLPVMAFQGETVSYRHIGDFAKKAERLGFDYISVNDHIVFRTGWLDPLVSLTTAAAATTKIKLGTSILNTVLRNPVIVAKSLASLDVISGGRVYIGVGPGSYKPDYDACGIPFEERWRRFSESLEVLTRVLQDSPANYSGSFYKVKELTIDPKPLQKPRPQIWIGSWGSEAGLKRVAKYGDGWMASAYNITPDQFKERWRKVLSYAIKYGKNPETIGNALVTMFGYVSRDSEKARNILKAVLAPALGRSVEELQRLLPFGTPTECINILQKLAEAGVRRIHFWPVGDEDEQIEILSKEIIPAMT